MRKFPPTMTQPAFLHRLGDAMVRLSKRPDVRLFVGASLFITGVDDLVEEFVGNEGLFDISVYHGVTILGIQHLIHAVGDMLEGISDAAELRAAKHHGERE
jgi:adenosine/AMP kinase